MRSLVGQRTFDDLGTPLAEVTFCVLDLETTGGDPGTCAITEIGAVKVRGGEPLGTFRTFVNPGIAIPRRSPCSPASPSRWSSGRPPVDAVLPTLLEFVGVERARRPQPPLRRVVPRRRPRARRIALASGSAPSTPARWPGGSCATRCPTAGSAPWPTASGSPTGPRHRALDDALATADLLHALLERAAAYGVTGLDDLLALPQHRRPPPGGEAQAHQPPAAPARRLPVPRPRRAGPVRRQGHRPAQPGALLLLHRRPPEGRADAPRGARHRPPPVRARRSRRPSSRPGCSTPSGRRYNRHGTRWEHAAYVRLDVDEAWPRLVVARSHRGPRRRARAAAVGPRRPAGRRGDRRRRAAAALHHERRRRAASRCATPPCAPAQLGVAHCPCAGTVDEAAYRAVVDRVVRGLTVDPTVLLDPLAERDGAAGRGRALRGGGRRARPGRRARRGAAPAAPLRRAAGRRAGRAGAARRRQRRPRARGAAVAAWRPGSCPGVAEPIGRGLVAEPPSRHPPARPCRPKRPTSSWPWRRSSTATPAGCGCCRSRASGPRPGPASPPSAPPPAERASSA